MHTFRASPFGGLGGWEILGALKGSEGGGGGARAVDTTYTNPLAKFDPWVGEGLPGGVYRGFLTQALKTTPPHTPALETTHPRPSPRPHPPQASPPHTPLYQEGGGGQQ